MNHCVIDCIPIDPSFSKQAPAYYKKELSEAESDWTDNKSIINIPKGKLLRNCSMIWIEMNCKCKCNKKYFIISYYFIINFLYYFINYSSKITSILSCRICRWNWIWSYY